MIIFKVYAEGFPVEAVRRRRKYLLRTEADILHIYR